MRPVKKQAIVLSIILIIILGFAVYGNSLNGKFVWDDEFLVEENTYIKSWSCISNIFTKNLAANVDKQSSFYRPFQLFTYAVDYSLWKLNVSGYHLTNILLHILAALSIYWLINILYDNRILSLFTSMLFIAHPIHTEAVSYISGRADSLALVFMFLCFILYIKNLHSNNKVVYILMSLSYILALLSRESSLILPALLLLYHYTFKKSFKIKQSLPILSIAIAYILLRTTVLKSMLTSVLCETTLFQRIPGFFVAITSYMRLLFLPLNLHMEYGNRVFNFTDPRAISGIVILLLLLIYAFRKRNTNNLIFFSILWFFITLLPQSNLYPISAYMAEHWLYLPSIGFFLIVGSGLSYLYKRKETRIFAICLIAGLVSFYSYLTIRQNNYWREPITFYKRTLKYAPASSTINNNLGVLYYNVDKKDQAIVLYKKAISINPNYVKSYNNLAIIYYDMDKKDQAIALFKKAIEIDPTFANAYCNLATAYKEFNKTEEVIALYKKAIQINPDLVNAYNSLAMTYGDIGNSEKAIPLLKKAIQIDPNYASAYSNLGLAYKNTGNREEAIPLFKKAITINPDLAQAYYNLGNIYANVGKNEEAIASYEKTIQLNPDIINVYNNLGVIYINAGNNEKAIPLLKKAIQIDPNYAPAHNNLGFAYKNTGNREGAIPLFKKAIEIDPNYATAHFNLSRAYYDDKQYGLAVKHCNRAIRLGYKVDPEFLGLLEVHRK